jgi:hypothetical protein
MKEELPKENRGSGIIGTCADDCISVLIRWLKSCSIGEDSDSDGSYLERFFLMEKEEDEGFTGMYMGSCNRLSIIGSLFDMPLLLPVTLLSFWKYF